MKRTLCLLLSVSFVSLAAYGQEPTKPDELTDPLEILKKVDAAARAVSSFKYKSVAEAPAAFAARFGYQKIEATFIVNGVTNGQPEKFFVDAKITLPGEAGTRRVTAGSDNDMFYIIDHQGKIAYEDIDPAVMGAAGNFLQRAMMIELSHPTPFSDEMNGRSRELRGSETVGGEDCYVVHVVYASEQSPEATWSFSKKNFLPLKRIDAYGTPGGGQPATHVKTLTDLVVDPKVTDEMFQLKLPEGYTKTDDFAPNFLAQQRPPA
jgi:hypothetical protein